MHALSLILTQTNNLRVKEHDPSKIYCNRKSTRPGMYVGELPTDVASNAVSGFLYVVNENELHIQLFNYMRGECTGTCLLEFQQ